MHNDTIARLFKADKSIVQPFRSSAHQDSVPRGPEAEEKHQLELKSADQKVRRAAQLRDESNDRLHAIKESSLSMARANPTSVHLQKYEEEAYMASMEIHLRSAPTRKSAKLFHPIFKSAAIGDVRGTNPHTLEGLSGEPYHLQMQNVHKLASEFATGVVKDAHVVAMKAHEYAAVNQSMENSISANIASANRLIKGA